MKMEERHSVSEPRPVKKIGNMPSWEVDILRDDTLIVDTFLLNKQVLPPRTNKKGKVVWRLPDTADKLPSFGTDDRRRILDIFKERKKRRKQEKKKRNDSSPPLREDVDIGKCDQCGNTQTSPGAKGSGGRGSSGNYEWLNSLSKSPGEDRIGGGELKPKFKWKYNGESSNNLSTSNDLSTVRGGQDETGNRQRRKMEGVQSELGREETGYSLKKAQQATTSRSAPLVPGLSPPGLGVSPSLPISRGPNSSTLPTQRQHQGKSVSTQSHLHVPNTPDVSRLILDGSRDMPSPPQPHPSHERLSFSSQTLPIQASSLPFDALFITVPRDEQPESISGESNSSLAVPAARHFISRYYSHFDGRLPTSQIGDLIRYYTSKAQKSVSIGGAHSVVTGRKGIAAQILNLAGAAFVVRGVVAQDTSDEKGVHILVTGTARTSLNGSAGGVVANFAHSISLVPIDDGCAARGEMSCPALIEALELGSPFQIHNDALALLNGDGPVTPAQMPQPVVQLQQPPPPPPPGLFSFQVE